MNSALDNVQNILSAPNKISENNKIFETVNGTDSPYDKMEKERLSRIEEGKRFVIDLLERFDCLSYSQIFKALSLYKNPQHEDFYFASMCLTSLSKTDVLMFKQGHLISNAKSVQNDEIEKAFWVFLHFVELGEARIKGAWASSGGLSNIYFSRIRKPQKEAEDAVVDDCQIFCVAPDAPYDTAIVFKELNNLGTFENPDDFPVVVFVVNDNAQAKKCFQYVPKDYDHQKLLFAVMPDSSFAPVESYQYLTSSDTSKPKSVQFPHIRILDLKK